MNNDFEDHVDLRSPEVPLSSLVVTNQGISLILGIVNTTLGPSSRGSQKV